MDAQLQRLIQAERRRIIGAQLASEPLSGDDHNALNAGAGDVADAGR